MSAFLCSPEHDHKVLPPAFDRGQSHWADCERCGRQPAQHKIVVSKNYWRTERRVDFAVVYFPAFVRPEYWTMYLYRCGKCGEPAAPRVIKLRDNPAAKDRKCGGACLNGRVSCDCRCKGRCHGAGECLGGHD